MLYPHIKTSKYWACFKSARKSKTYKNLISTDDVSLDFISSIYLTSQNWPKQVLYLFLDICRDFLCEYVLSVSIFGPYKVPKKFVTISAPNTLSNTQSMGSTLSSMFLPSWRSIFQFDFKTEQTLIHITAKPYSRTHSPGVLFKTKSYFSPALSKRWSVNNKCSCYCCYLVKCIAGDSLHFTHMWTCVCICGIRS